MLDKAGVSVVGDPERAEMMGMGDKLEVLDTSNGRQNVDVQSAVPPESAAHQGSARLTKPTRLSVNISRDTFEALQEVSTEKNVTITEALRRLVGYGIMIYRANRDGQDVLLRRDNKTERIVLVD